MKYEYDRPLCDILIIVIEIIEKYNDKRCNEAIK